MVTYTFRTCLRLKLVNEKNISKLGYTLKIVLSFIYFCFFFLFNLFPVLLNTNRLSLDLVVTDINIIISGKA